MVAVLLSAALFGAIHTQQGSFGVAWAVVAGLVYGIFFVRVRRIWPLVLAHTLWNVVVTGW